jgi:hypothetical protein
MKCCGWGWMRCHKPVTTYWTTWNWWLGMGRVVKPEVPWRRWNPYSGLPPTTGPLVLWRPRTKDSYFVLGCLLLVPSYDMQENTVGILSHPCTYKGPEPTRVLNQSSRTGTQLLITSRAPLVPFSRLLRHAWYSGPILIPDPRGSFVYLNQCSYHIDFSGSLTLTVVEDNII